MATTFDQAWEKDSPPPSLSLSQDELIAEFIRLDELAKGVNSSRREIAMQLAGITFENKGEQRTVRLESSKGAKVKVEFGSETVYDVELMKDVVNLLGPEKFDELFKTKLEFVANKRPLNTFLNTVSSSEAQETAKQIIKQAEIRKDKQPYVTCEQGKE